MNLSIATASCFAVRYVEYIIVVEVKVIMETKSIILELRDKAGLSQDELAEKVYVTRQAVILSILVDTFISKISFPMQPGPEIGSISDA